MFSSSLAISASRAEAARTTCSQIPRAQAPTDEADLTILLQAHSAYDLNEVAARAHLLFDTRGKLSGDSVFPL